MQSFRAAGRIGAVGPLSRSAPLRAASNISGGSMGRSWADREHAEESRYFNKRDADLLAKLASKLHKQTAPNENDILAARDEVVALCNKHGVQVPDALVDDVRCTSHLPEILPLLTIFFIELEFLTCGWALCICFTSIDYQI